MYSKIVSVSIITMMLLLMMMMLLLLMLLLLMMMLLLLMLLLLLMMMMMMLAAAAAAVVVVVDVDVMDVAIMWADHGGCCPQPLVFFVHQESCHAKSLTLLLKSSTTDSSPLQKQHILLFLGGKNG